MCVVIFMVDCSTYINVNTISHNGKNSTTIRSLKVTPHTLLTSHYSRTIPSSLSYFTFSHQTLYTFPFPPTVTQAPNVWSPLIISLSERLVTSTNLVAFHSALSSSVLLLPSSFALISASQHSALEHPVSTCDLRLSSQLTWHYSAFGLWRDVIL